MAETDGRTGRQAGAGSGFIGLWRCFLALRRADAPPSDKKGSARGRPGRTGVRVQPAAFGFSGCASDGEAGGREAEEHRSCVRAVGGGTRGGGQ